MLLNIKRQTSLCNHTVKLSLFSYSAEKINIAASVLGQLADCLYVYTFLIFLHMWECLDGGGDISHEKRRSSGMLVVF